MSRQEDMAFDNPEVGRAWRAFEDGRLDESEQAWSELIAAAEGDTRDAYLRMFGYVLVAQRRFDDARELYRRLFERHGTHKDLHQLGMVERKAEALGDALDLFLREAEMIEDTDVLGIAANLYEQSLVHHLLGHRQRARQLLVRCHAMAEASRDRVMIGAAYRLKGDLLARDAPEEARQAYEASVRSFEEAKDGIGAKEVRQRIAALSRAGQGEPGSARPPGG